MGRKKNQKTSRNLENQLKFDNGFVFYERLNDDKAFQASYWKKIYTSSMSDFNSSLNIFNELNNEVVGESLIKRGYIEQQKELNFLRKIFHISITDLRWQDYPKYINKINEIIGLQDDYKYLLQTIKKRSTGKERAPSAMAYLESYLTTTLTENLRRFFQTKQAKDIIEVFEDKELWDYEFRRIYSKSLEEAIVKISNQKEKIDKEEIQIWKKVINLLNTTESYFDEIKSLVAERYNLDKVSEEVFKWEKERRNNKITSTRGLHTKIKNSYNIGEREIRSINGLVEEYVSAAFKGKGEINEKGVVFPSNVMRADTAKVYSANLTLNLTPITENLKEWSSESKSLIDAERILDRFNKEYLDNIPETFVVYENTKAYTMGNSFRGFHSGGAKPLKSLPEYLEAMEATFDGKDLVTLLYNTVNGTIGYDRQEEIKENSSLVLSELLANFMFDDWASIGNTTNQNAIHMFNLNGVRIPLSYLLIAMGMAVKEVSNSKTYFKVSFNLPKEIKWPNPIGRNEGDEPWDPGRGMVSYWQEQKEIFEGQSKFSVKFLSNFKTLLADLLRNL